MTAIGDGSDYLDSATSAPSETYVYVKPTTQLDTPTGADWVSNSVAGWSPVDHAARYRVQLCCDGAPLDNPVYTTDTTYDFTQYFAQTGMYSFTVQAIGNENYANSAVSDNSNDIEYEKPIEPLAVPVSPFWDASVPAKATWEGVLHAVGYSVQLAMDGSDLGEPVTVSADTFAYDFTSVATETGAYTFNVKALGDGTVYADSVRSVPSDRYCLVALPKLDRPTNPVWDATIPGKAKWTGVANATGYSVQLSIDLMAEFDPVTVASDVTEYDFTSLIDETGSYTFTVVATGSSERYRPSDPSTVSGAYDYVKPTLSSITADFRQGGTAVYTSGTLDSLKPMLTVTANYSDGATKTVTDYTLSGSLYAGESSISVVYLGKATSFTVNVTEVALQSITASFAQGGTAVYPTTGMEVVRSLLTVTGTNNDGTPADVSGYEILGALSPGECTLTASFRGMTTTFTVNVTALALESISASFAQGDKVIYTSTDLPVLRSLLTVTSRRNDGNTESVSGYELSGTLTAGASTITVTYQGKTTTFTVNVTAVVLASITAEYYQYMTVYAGDTLESLRSKLSVWGRNNDDSVFEIPEGYTLSGTLAEGTSTITVTYQGKSTTVDVTVFAAELTSVSATFNPGSKTIYEGDTLDSLKPMLTVIGTYNNGATATITDYTLDGILSAGTETVLVYYNNLHTTFTVNVTEVALESITATFTQGDTVVYEGASAETLRSKVRVTAHYTDGSTQRIDAFTLEGTLTAGTSTITVAFGGKTATFTVNVTEEQSVAFDHAQLLLCPNDAQQLGLVVTPRELAERGVVWSSSDTTVATVDATGLVSAVGTGAATITAILRDTPDATAACQVTVAQILTMRLPGGLAEIREEAFANTPAERIVAGENLSRIAARAFKDCSALKIIELGSSVTEISDDAFVGCTGVIIVCPEGSTAVSFAKRHGMECYVR